MCLLPARHVRLKFASPDYALQDGSALVLSAEIFSTPAGRGPDDPPLLPLVNGIMDPSPALVSGRYVAVLNDVTLIRLSDNLRIRIARMHVGPFLITDSNVQSGSATIRIDIPGVYRVTLLDSTGRTVPSGRISIQDTLHHVLELTTDARGQATIVGKPDKLLHIVPLDARDQHVNVEPL